MGMQSLVSSRRSAYRLEVDPRAARLRSVLAAASRTAFYRYKFENLSDRPYAFEILGDLPPVSFKNFVEHRDQFTNPRARPADSRAKGIRLIPDGWRRKLGLAIEAIVGSQADLAKLAARIVAGEPVSGRGARRLLVYTQPGERMLDPELRDRLWQAFELPIFVQLRGFEGELLASECEAHEGMHLETESGIFEVLDGELVLTSLLGLRHPVLRLRTGLEGKIVPGACLCGEMVSSFLQGTRREPQAL